MKKVNFNISINASAKKVWQVLWNDSTYRKWTSAFAEGSYAESDWKEGGSIRFLGPEGSGMFSVIDKMTAPELMAFKHMGEVKAFKNQELNEQSSEWTGCMEIYRLKETSGVTELSVELDALLSFVEFFESTFPKALAIVKELSEKSVAINISAEINAPKEKIWNYFTAPDHICKWNSAAPEWHTPKAVSDLKVGGKFLYRMEAKDGSFGFDFEGTFDKIEPNALLEYTIADGRKVKMKIKENGNGCDVTEEFEAEEENPLEMQRMGWQAILDNFKKYVESN